jgi:hypothetical protein
MIRIIQWLGRNKIIAVLLAVVVYFCIVAFHELVTELAIRMRNAIGRDKYNDYLTYSFLLLLLPFIAILFYHSLRSRQKYLKLALSFIIVAMIVFSFRFLMVYSIEAIHFVEYALLAVILLPVLRSYRETVFWITILGILDELFQYHFLTPNFEYFDFNDITLNLLGAGAGVLLVFVFGGNVISLSQVKWYRSPAFITGAGILAVFFILLITGKMSVNPVESAASATWFSLNRKSMPAEFWTTAYPGRVFHILKTFEGIVVLIVLLAGFFLLDILTTKPEETLNIIDCTSTYNVTKQRSNDVTKQRSNDVTT